MATFNATFNPDSAFNASMQDGGQGMNGSFDHVIEVETADYNKLANKPRINDEEVVGNKTFEDYGEHILTNIEIKQIFDNVFKRGE